MNKDKRGQWSSGFGFVMAAAGAAVGLGNIWGFPYKMGQGGGFIFLLLYLFFVVVVGYPILVGELALGRHFGKGAVGTFKAINPRLKLLGVMGVLACFIILGYYAYFGGVIIEYTISYANSIFQQGVNGSNLVVGGTSAGISTIWMIVFMAVTLIIVMQGVEKGIESCSKIMMPLLVIMLVYMAGKALSMQGAREALKYMFKPDLSKLNAKTISLALTQVFFSLSLGQGVMITYGSYLGKKEKIAVNAAIIPLFDTTIAILAAMVVIPAVFSFGMAPDAGPGLMFDALPLIFSEMRGGNLMGLMFFTLLLFATVTSSISMLETVASSLTEQLGTPKKKASIIITCLTIAIGLPICSDPSLFTKYEHISQNVIVVLGTLVMCLMCGWGRTGRVVKKEIELEGNKFPFKRLWRGVMAYVTPVFILFVLLISLGIIKFT